MADASCSDAFFGIYLYIFRKMILFVRLKIYSLKPNKACAASIQKPSTII